MAPLVQYLRRAQEGRWRRPSADRPTESVGNLARETSVGTVFACVFWGSTFGTTFGTALQLLLLHALHALQQRQLSLSSASERDTVRPSAEHKFNKRKVDFQSGLAEQPHELFAALRVGHLCL